MKDILVVYYSRTGKTRFLAQQLAGLLGADLEEIQEKKDRSGVLGYMGGGKDAALHRPAELTSSHSRESRKVVIIGMPVWAWGPPPAVRAYLATYSPAAGAKVCAFCTYEGSGGARCLEAVRGLLGRDLTQSFEWKKVKIEDPTLTLAIKEWAGKIKSIAD
jgi:flavodoxin